MDGRSTEEVVRFTFPFTCPASTRHNRRGTTLSALTRNRLKPARIWLGAG